MRLSRKYFNVPAGSLIESVVALSIIAICLVTAVLIYSQVFTKRTSTDFYNRNNVLDEIFFATMLGQDSIIDRLTEGERIRIEEEVYKGYKMIRVSSNDSIKTHEEKYFCITAE
ncbi:hypothetical protein VF13_39825 [Nostoc linckia z16]|nr:hypothetical protein VF13_39825 [Nostoc linckia z16]